MEVPKHASLCPECNRGTVKYRSTLSMTNTWRFAQCNYCATVWDLPAKAPKPPKVYPMPLPPEEMD